MHSASRTWSRHAPPDWTNQARYVDRPEDIIINRDSVMEEGRLRPDESEKRELELAAQGDKEGSSQAPTKRDGESIEGTLGESSGSVRGDSPSRGETITEWQEGHHRVIEREGSFGSDVSSSCSYSMTLGLTPLLGRGC